MPGSETIVVDAGGRALSAENLTNAATIAHGVSFVGNATVDNRTAASISAASGNGIYVGNGSLS
jgi:hypothetical protein